MTGTSSTDATRVAVTGGAGFIGTHTVEALLAVHATVLVIDDKSHPCAEALPTGAEIVEADCGSEAAEHALARFKPELVLHLASKGGVHQAARNPGEHVRHSVASTIALYDSAIRSGARRIVTASSGGTVYGDARRLPARESSEPAPVAAYGAAKRAEEVYLSAFGRRYGISTVALRYGNVYGPRQDGTGEAGMVAITCYRLFEGRPPRVFGDGNQTRDFTYVGDVAEANVKALFGKRSGEVNVGTGRETSVNDIVSALIKHSQIDRPTEFEPAREGEVRRVCLDATRAERWFGWTCRVPVETGLGVTWSWFCKRLSQARAAK
jgi:UDP-glucose 4-epimerase